MLPLLDGLINYATGLGDNAFFDLMQILHVRVGMYVCVCMSMCVCIYISIKDFQEQDVTVVTFASVQRCSLLFNTTGVVLMYRARTFRIH